jgi:archaellum biogenesis protein FlaJ (TadC family)
MKTKSVIMRFLKGAVSGSISAMMLVSLVMPSTWSGFLPLLQALAIAGTFGALTGLLLAVEKWASWED